MTKQLIENLMKKHNIKIGHGKGSFEGEYWISLKIKDKQEKERDYKITYYKDKGSIQATIYDKGQEDIFAYRSLLVFPLLALQKIAYKEQRKFKINSSYKNRSILDAYVDYDPNDKRTIRSLNDRKIFEWMKILEIVTNHPSVHNIIKITPNILFKTITGETLEIKWDDYSYDDSYKIKQLEINDTPEKISYNNLEEYLNKYVIPETVLLKAMEKLSSNNSENFSKVEVQALLNKVVGISYEEGENDLHHINSNSYYFENADSVLFVEAKDKDCLTLKSS
ncbi:hypothetical protein C1N73_27085 (plasmid) [Priestia aryabhattai]